MDSINTSLIDSTLDDLQRQTLLCKPALDRPDKKRLGFLLTVNYACRRPNISWLLTEATNITLFLGLALYGATADTRYLLLCLVGDLGCNVVALIFAFNHPTHFRMHAKTGWIRGPTSEILGFVFRLAICGLLIFSYFMNERLLGWVCAGLAFSLLITSTWVAHSKPYESVFSTIQLITLALLSMKFSQSIEISWTAVFWLQKLYFWIMLAILGTFQVIWLVVSICKLCGKANTSWPSLAFNSLACCTVVTSKSVVFAIHGLIEDFQPIVPFSLTLTAGTAAGLHLARLLLGLKFQDCLMFNMRLEEVQAAEVVKYSLDIVQVGPYAFARKKQAADLPLATTTYLCFVCRSLPANCLWQPCLHGGVCSTCVSNFLKTNHLCPHCEHDIGTTFATEKTNSEVIIAYKEFTRAE